MKRNFTRRRVIANPIDEILSSDLVEMQQFSKWNKGYKYLLMVLELFFKTIFKEGRKPQFYGLIRVGFYNKHLKELLDKHNITICSTENEEKSSVIERWNRTIRYLLSMNSNTQIQLLIS